jgi:hypothetical protein
MLKIINKIVIYNSKIEKSDENLASVFHIKILKFSDHFSTSLFKKNFKISPKSRSTQKIPGFNLKLSLKCHKPPDS